MHVIKVQHSRLPQGESFANGGRKRPQFYAVISLSSQRRLAGKCRFSKVSTTLHIAVRVVCKCSRRISVFEAVSSRPSGRVSLREPAGNSSRNGVANNRRKIVENCCCRSRAFFCTIIISSARRTKTTCNTDATRLPILHASAAF